MSPTADLTTGDIAAGVAEALADTPEEVQSQQPTEAPPPLESEAITEDTSTEEAPPAEEAAPVDDEAAPPSPTDAQSYIDSLLKPISEGGIGHVPTTQEMGDYYRAYVDQRLFDSDVLSGDPQGRLVGHILNSPRAADIISKIPSMLERGNPQMLHHISRPIIASAAESLWRQMRSAPKGELKESLYQAAQHLHHEVYGKYRPVDDAEPQSTVQSDREVDLERRERALQNQARNADQSAFRAWHQNVITGNLQALAAEIDRALEPAKKSVAPVVYEGLRDQYTKKVNSRILANSEGLALQGNAVTAAARSGNPADVIAQREHFLRLARPEIAATRAEFLKSAGITVLANSAARHAQLKTASQQKSPNGVAAAPRKSIQPNRTYGSDADFRRDISREIGAALGT